MEEWKMKAYSLAYKVITIAFFFATVFLLQNVALLYGQGNVLLYDGFDSPPLNTALWQTGGNSACSSVTISNGTLVIVSGTSNGGGRWVESKATFTPNQDALVLEMRVLHSAADGGAWGFAGDNGNGIVYFENSLQGNLLTTVLPCNPGCTPFYIIVPNVDVRVWHTYQIELTASNAKFYVDGALVATHSQGIPQNKPMRVKFDRGSRGQNQTLSVDYVQLRSGSSTGTFSCQNFTRVYLPLIVKGGSGGSPGSPNVETVVDCVKATTGGSITLGQTKLTIPPGALSQDTIIRMSRPVNVPDVGDWGVGYIFLEPSGLVFNSSVTLEIGYVEPLTFDEEWLDAYSFSESDGREEKLNVISRDTANNKIAVEVSHFSSITTIYKRPIYVVPHLSGRYLQEG
jgi:hypothetical protein